MQADGNGFMVHILSKHDIYRNCWESKKKKLIKLSVGTCAKQRITIQNKTNLLFLFCKSLLQWFEVWAYF